MDDDRDSQQVDQEGRRAFRSGRVRIVGAEPADPTLSIPVVSASGGDADGGPAFAGPADRAHGDAPAAGGDPGAGAGPSAGSSDGPDATELPHWTEAPTGEVPAVLSSENGDRAGADPWASLPKPSWREEGADWGGDEGGFEPSMLPEGEPGMGSRRQREEEERQPWSFDLPGQAPADDPVWSEPPGHLGTPGQFEASGPSETSGQLEGTAPSSSSVDEEPVPPRDLAEEYRRADDEWAARAQAADAAPTGRRRRHAGPFGTSEPISSEDEDTLVASLDSLDGPDPDDPFGPEALGHNEAREPGARHVAEDPEPTRGVIGRGARRRADAAGAAADGLDLDEDDAEEVGALARWRRGRRRGLHRAPATPAATRVDADEEFEGRPDAGELRGGRLDSGDERGARIDGGGEPSPARNGVSAGPDHTGPGLAAAAGAAAAGAPGVASTGFGAVAGAAGADDRADVRASSADDRADDRARSADDRARSADDRARSADDRARRADVQADSADDRSDVRAESAGERGSGTGSPAGTDAAAPVSPRRPAVRLGDVDKGVDAIPGDDPSVRGASGVLPPARRAVRRPVAQTPVAQTPVAQTPPGRPSTHRQRPLRPPAAATVSAQPEQGRNMTAAVLTGGALLVVALVAFRFGGLPALVVVSALVFLAAAEAYAAFRKAGYRPATLLGLLATISLMVATYNKGQAALPLLLVLLVAFTMLWYLGGVQPGAPPVEGIATTLLVFCWIGVFGSFAALLLDPTLFPNRHGIAFLLGGVITGIACDIGALAFGSWLGRHPLAPSVSPNKTWEGAIGGAACAILAAVIVVHAIHPWTLSKALALGVVVAVVSPLGDLAESLVKRHLGLKDMGRMLPGHGGVLDRVDGLLFVLPATYFLVKAVHLG